MSSGTVTLDSVSGDVFSGTFDIVLDSGDHVTGAFHPSACPGLVKPPEHIDRQLVDDFRAFREQSAWPIEWYSLGHTSSEKIVAKNTRAVIFLPKSNKVDTAPLQTGCKLRREHYCIPRPESAGRVDGSQPLK